MTSMYKLACISLALFLLSISAVHAQGQNSAKLKEAAKLYEAQEFQATLKILQELIEQEPDFIEAYELQAHTYFQLGNFEQARTSLTPLIQKGGINSDLLALLIEIDRLREDQPTLLNSLRFACFSEPENSRWQIMYIDTLRSLKLHQEAELVCQAFLKRDPSQVKIWLRLGNLLIEKENTKSSLHAFEVAYFLGSRLDSLTETIAELWLRLGHLSQALVWYKRAMEEKGLLSEANLRYAELLLKTGEHEQAKIIASNMLQEISEAPPHESSPSSALRLPLLKLLGQIALKQEMLNEAITFWEQVVNLEGNEDPKFSALLGSAAFNAERYHEAASFLKKSLQERPDRELHFYLVVSLIKEGRRPEAKEQSIGYIERYGLDQRLKQLITSLHQD